MKADKAKFKEKLLGHLSQYLCDIQDSDGNWTVKGFIDIFKNIYTISLDIAELTRILSVIKDIELPKPPYRNIKEYFEYKQGAKSDKND